MGPNAAAPLMAAALWLFLAGTSACAQDARLRDIRLPPGFRIETTRPCPMPAR